MPRKRYPSDRNTTTVRVTRKLHREVRKAAKKENVCIEEFVDIALTDAVQPPKGLPNVQI
jgi:predicted HicB family RNase H-like nuclease